MQIFNGSGKNVFNSDDITWNQVDMVYVPRGGSFAQTYAALSGREKLAVQMFIDPPPIDRQAIAHTITFNGNTVVINGGSENAYVIILMR